jgi:multidrug efflux pump subunit AcrA (membrane-fusion protein)
MGVRVAFLDRPPAGPDPGGPVRAGVLVPADAVRANGDHGVVYVYADGKVERRRVAPGSTFGTDRQVLSGLRPGDRVVVSPPDSLQDGAPVKLSEGG